MLVQFRLYSESRQRFGTVPTNRFRLTKPVSVSERRRRSAEVLAEAAARAKFQSSASGDLGPAASAKEERSSRSSSGALRTFLQRRQSALTAGLRRISSVFGGQPNQAASPLSAAGQSMTSSGSSSGDASAELRQQPSWLPRGCQPGGRQSAAGAAQAGPVPAVASQAAEAAAAFGLVKSAGRTQSSRLGRAGIGAASSLARGGSSSSARSNTGQPAASPPERTAATPPPNPFQEAAETGGSSDGGGAGGWEPASVPGEKKESPSLPPNPFQLASGAAF